MRFQRIFVSILFLAGGCSSVSNTKTPTTKSDAPLKTPTFFVSIPFTKFSAIRVPCLEVRIEDKIFSVELDLGCRGDLTLTKDFADQLVSKTFLRTTPIYGISGTEYQTNLYRIPKAKLGSMNFLQPILQEESQEFTKESIFTKGGGLPSARESGRLGWQLFYHVNLLIDVKNSKIACCDSLETLKKEGYSTENFVQTPLLLERGLVEFEIKTPNGPLRCMLDTGSTWNALHRELPKGTSLEEAVWDPSNVLECPSLKISNQEFGPLTFRQIPIKLPVHVEAILGMEFFEDHLIFLDFVEKYAYFAKGPSTNLGSEDL